MGSENYVTENFHDFSEKATTVDPDDKVLEKMYSRGVVYVGGFVYGPQLRCLPSLLQYICRPEIFEKYNVNDYNIRHPSAALMRDQPLSIFARRVVDFAFAGYESDDSEVDNSDDDSYPGDEF